MECTLGNKLCGHDMAERINNFGKVQAGISKRPRIEPLSATTMTGNKFSITSPWP